MNKFLLRRLGVADDVVGLRPSLQDCIEAVLAQSTTLIDDVLKGLEASTRQAKPKISQINYRPISKPALAQLRQHIDAVRATFGVQLRLAIYHSGAQDTVDQPLVRFADLQLLDAKQIDANIEYALAQQEIQIAVDDVLPAFNPLISSLLGWVTVQAHLNPLRPESFARALRECLVQHVPDEAARSALITPASGYLGVSLRQLYKELTDWLRTQGVEPVLPTSSSLSGDAAAHHQAGNSVSRTMLTLDKLRRLLAGELDSEAGSGRKAFLHTVPAPFVALEDLKMVEPMMKRLSQRASQPPSQTGAAPATPTERPAAQTHEPAQGKKLGRQLGEEVVRLMLDNLMQDQRLLPRVREQIRALEPVLLRLSQSDSRFFSDRRHPARQLLDKLTHRSLGYSDESDEGFKHFFQTMAEAVRGLVASQGDAQNFATVLKTLEARWSGADAEQRLRQGDAARALLHAEQRNLLAYRFAADFQEQTRDRNIPELVGAFLGGPWAQVVAESQLSCTDGTSDAEGYLALVDDLLWSVQVQLARRNRARLAQLVPALLAKLRQGLQLIQYPQERAALFFDELITLHEKAFAAPAEAAAAAGPVEDAGDSFNSLVGLAEEPNGETVWVVEHEADETGYLPEVNVVLQTPAPDAGALPRSWNVSDLEIGAWVQLSLKGEWVRAQLTWASPHRTLFMFVSGKGEAHSMSRRTMERLRSNSLMRVVAEGHVVDNALDAVAQTALRNDRDQASRQS